MWIFAVTEKSAALRPIRETDPSRYTAICRILAEEEFEDWYETIPLEYAYDLADKGPSPEDAVFETEMKTAVGRVLSSLTPREERVLRRRFGIGLKTDATLETIGIDMCVTRGRIRQIEEKALRKLKHHSRNKEVRPFISKIAA